MFYDLDTPKSAFHLYNGSIYKCEIVFCRHNNDGVYQMADHAHTSPPPQSSSVATQELDTLMATLSDFKVCVELL